ncbi:MULTISPECIES: hypothetical protein [unclassified Butyricimonas]|uniref:hypothetical protein n=1 Tax=unclassified Butyricimonas TaxID=2637652 RepID=UPI000C076C1F|nr:MULTISPECIES: hypothetical protein [unclassified Butyricimonas]
MQMNLVSGFSSLAGFLWIFTAINPFYLWNPLENRLTTLVGVLVVIATLFLYNRRKLFFTSKRLLLAFSVFVFFAYLTWRLDDGILATAIRFFIFFPLILLAFWRNELLYKVYSLFRNVIVFLAIGSCVIAICAVTGIIQYLPYYELEAQSNVHEMAGVTYRVYGCIVVTAKGGFLSSVIPRACGPLQEPGHFAIILGFIFLIDRFARNSISKWIVICGMLTFSINFVILAGLGELYDMMVNKVGWRKLKIYLSFLLFCTIIFFSLDESLQAQLSFLLYERNLEQIVGSFISTNSLQGALDERINQTGAYYYEQFTHSSKVISGLGKLDSEVVLSDYRGLILLLGYIGLILSVILAYTALLGAKFRQGIFLICALFLVYLHRAWMMHQPYIYFLIFIAICMYNYSIYSKRVYDSK